MTRNLVLTILTALPAGAGFADEAAKPAGPTVQVVEGTATKLPLAAVLQVSRKPMGGLYEVLREYTVQSPIRVSTTEVVDGVKREVSRTVIQEEKLMRVEMLDISKHDVEDLSGKRLDAAALVALIKEGTRLAISPDRKHLQPEQLRDLPKGTLVLQPKPVPPKPLPAKP